MNPLTWLLTLPFQPLRGVIALGEVVHDQVEQELHGSAAIRRDLEAAADAEAAGELGCEERAELERRIVERAVRSRHTDPGTR